MSLAQQMFSFADVSLAKSFILSFVYVIRVRPHRGPNSDWLLIGTRIHHVTINGRMMFDQRSRLF